MVIKDPFGDAVQAEVNALIRREAAMSAVAEVNQRTREHVGEGPEGPRILGGDPGSVAMPFEWLASMIGLVRQEERHALYGTVQMQELRRVWDELVDDTEDEYERLHAAHPELAEAVRAFMGQR